MGIVSLPMIHGWMGFCGQPGTWCAATIKGPRTGIGLTTRGDSGQLRPPPPISPWYFFAYAIIPREGSIHFPGAVL